VITHKETAVTDTQYQLIVRKGPKVGETFLLDTISLTIGRDPVSDVVLNDPEVSRQHTRFSQIETGYQVQDLGSTNGTFVNGERLESDPVDLQPGFTISMGSGVTLIYGEVPAEDPQAATMIDQGGLADMLSINDDMDGLDEEPPLPDGWEPDPSPPFTPPPPAPSPPATAPLVPASSEDEDEAAKKKRRNTTIIVAAAIVMLCCCGFIAFMYFVGGDLILEAIGAI